MVTGGGGKEGWVWDGTGCGTEVSGDEADEREERGGEHGE